MDDTVRRCGAGEFVKEYCERTGPHFVVGEYWDSLQYEHGVAAYCQNQHRQQIVNWINAAGGQATAFDVTTKGILCAPLPPCTVAPATWLPSAPPRATRFSGGRPYYNMFRVVGMRDVAGSHDIGRRPCCTHVASLGGHHAGVVCASRQATCARHVRAALLRSLGPQRRARMCVRHSGRLHAAALLRGALSRQAQGLCLPMSIDCRR